MTGGVPPSNALIPAWLDRVGTLILLAVVGTVAAWGAVWLLVGFGFGGDTLFVAWIFNLPLAAKLSCVCGLIVGVAGASASTWPATLRRAGLAALVLLVLGAGAMAWVASQL